MRNFILTILIISILFALSQSVTYSNNWFYSFFMSFAFLLMPVFLSTTVLYFIKAIFKRTSLILQMTIMFLIILISIFLVHLPDYLRHQNEVGYTPYNSLTEYFRKELLMAFLMTIAFSITIPIINTILERKLNVQKSV